MIIEKQSMSKEELKEAAKRHKQEIANLKAGDNIKHKGKVGYIAIVEKIYKNGKIDFKVIEEAGKKVDWRGSFHTVTKYTSVLYTFNECFELI